MNNDIVRLAQAMDFAARKHVSQKRKGEAEEPYVNHLTEVARRLAEASDGMDANLVMAGLLHDTIEDQEVTQEELVDLFGTDVANLVMEVTDNKSLPKAERKQLQVLHAPKKSARGRMLKMADKTANLFSILQSPPADWDVTRKQEYFDWAKAVVDGCRGVNVALELEFDRAYAGRP